MKTARLPSCPRLSKFLELNGEAAAIQAEIDTWHQNELITKLTDVQYHEVAELAILLTPAGEEPDDQLIWDLNEAFLNAVSNAAEATAVHINMMERKIGLVSQDSPSELAKEAIRIYTDTQSKIIEAMWNNV